MGALDLKKLSKGMNIRDKMKLLFEDSNKQAETDGKEHILTAQERDAIIEDARKSGEIREIRRVNELYRHSNFISIELEIYNLSFLLSITSLEKSLMGIVLKGACEEIIGEMIHDLVKQDGTSQSEFEMKSDELRKKYRVDSALFKGFDFFDSNIEDDSHMPDEYKNNNLQPNPDLQRYFILSYKHAMKIVRKLFEKDYVVAKAPIDFLATQSKDLIKESEELLSLFNNLDQTLRPLRIYRDYAEQFFDISKIKNSEFIELIQNLPTKLILSDKEKDDLRAKIDTSLKQDL